MKFFAALVIPPVIAVSAAAATLAPVTLDEQIARASKIFLAHVESVTPVEESTGRAIVTEVSVARIAGYKGDIPETLAFRLLGGKVGDREMRVDGMPQFEAGKDYVIFLNDTGTGKVACPIVGWTEGCLPVDRAAGTVQLSETVRGGFADGSGDAAPSDLGNLEVFEAALRAKIEKTSGS